MIDDSRFFAKCTPLSIDQILAITGCKLDSKTRPLPPGTLKFNGVAPLERATVEEISVLNNNKYIDQFKISKAGACFIEEKHLGNAPDNMMLFISNNPYKAYALVAQNFYPQPQHGDFIAPTAYLDPSAEIGKNCHISAGVYIGANVKIGNNCYIGPNTSIETGVVIGENSRISANVTISHSLIGNNVLIHPGVRIGQDGFGFASDRQGHYKIPQLGRVIIGNNVEIGANSCIDRGSGHDTKIDDFCMIDNLVQIAHNVELGKGCVVVSQVGISGSTKFGDFVVAGGQAGFAGHLNIGSGAQIAAQSGVIKNINPMETQGGYPAVPIREWHKQTAILKKLLKKNKGDNNG